jgi:hypothetical protein
MNPDNHTFLLTMAAIAVIIFFALAVLIWLSVRTADDIEQALDAAERELQQRPRRVGVVHNHMNDSGERVRPLFNDTPW